MNKIVDRPIECPVCAAVPIGVCDSTPHWICYCEHCFNLIAPCRNAKPHVPHYHTMAGAVVCPGIPKVPEARTKKESLWWRLIKRLARSTL